MAEWFADTRLICLDLDDTLWPCMPTILRAEQAMYGWLQAEAPALAVSHTVESLRAHRLEVAAARPEQAHDLSAIRRIALQALLPRYGYHHSLAEGACEVFRHHRNQVEPYDEVIPALQHLRQHFILVSVSNGNAQVEKTPLAGLFHHSFSAEEVGAAKPDPALFRAAMTAAGIDAAQTLHVGDDPLRDVQAAREIGLSVAWMNRDGQDWPSDLGGPPPVLPDLADLLRLLGLSD